MTNKEAIEILNQQKYPYPEHYKDIEVNEALDLAIKSLKERPQGEWEDYSADFYKCPECGYLLNKLCPQCYNKVILPKGGAE